MIIKNDDGTKTPSDNFLFWCEKTKHLTDEQWSIGFKALEREIISNKRDGKESWPPSYVEFLEMSKPESIRFMCSDDPRHPINDPASIHFRPRLSKDPEIKKRNEKKRDEILTSLKDLMK